MRQHGDETGYYGKTRPTVTIFSVLRPGQDQDSRPSLTRIDAKKYFCDHVVDARGDWSVTVAKVPYDNNVTPCHSDHEQIFAHSYQGASVEVYRYSLEVYRYTKAALILYNFLQVPLSLQLCQGWCNMCPQTCSISYSMQTSSDAAAVVRLSPRQHVDTDLAGRE